MKSIKTKIIYPAALSLLAFTMFAPAAALHGKNVSLKDIQELALAHNPRIKAMEREAAMMKKRIPRASALDDPKLKFGVNNLPAGSLSFKKENMTSKEIGVSQMIPLWGKLSSKERIATLEYQKAVERLRLERIEMLHILRMNVYELVNLHATAVILNEIKDQLKLVIDSELAANKAGIGSLSNVIKANIEYTMIDEELITLRQKEKEAEQKIIYLVGEKVEFKFSELPEPEFSELKSDDIKAGIIASNPGLAIMRLDKEIADEEISLKKKEYIPDVDLGLSYMQRDPGPEGRRDNMITGMATINIPFWFWKKNIPMVDEMRKKSEATGNLVIDKRNELDSKAETLLSRINKWRDLYRLYHDRLIPQTALALETNLSRYKSGKMEFMPVIDNVRMLLRYRKDLIMTKTEYYISYSELNSLLGTEILP